MGRFLLGVGLLAVLLGLGLWVCKDTDDTLLQVSDRLEAAAALCLSGQALDGASLAKEAKDAWEQAWHRTAVFSDHAPMDEIDGLFSQLEAFRENSREFAAGCRRIASLIRAVAEANNATWWNIF